MNVHVLKRASIYIYIYIYITSICLFIYSTYIDLYTTPKTLRRYHLLRIARDTAGSSRDPNTLGREETAVDVGGCSHVSKTYPVNMPCGNQTQKYGQSHIYRGLSQSNLHLLRISPCHV